ncbi:MAG: peroxidase [bacterium]|nr:peroxidase [bacterium]
MAQPPVARPLALADIQALALRAHPDLSYVSYVFFRVVDRVAALAALAAMQSAITTAKAVTAPPHKRPKTRLQLAFSHTGLAQLGLDDGARRSFSPEFQSGMAEPARSRRLGDRGDSAPDEWELGGAAHRLDVLVALFAATTEARTALVDEWTARLAPGLVVEAREDSMPRQNQREHFGFRDGISQPVLRGDPTRAHVAAADRIADGEFLFGYANEYGKLPAAPRTAGDVDLGDNGTYRVFRQLERLVARFWRYFHVVAGGAAHEAERLASKVVGRWPSGAPLVLAPEHDNPRLGGDMAHNNHFMYRDGDPIGGRCPAAAHIRRANPRDARGSTAEESLTMVRRRRIIRRGRPYGDPPRDAQPQHEDGTRRGLYFLAVNINIARQFEFVQQTWLNNPKFAGLANDRDAVVAQAEDGGAVSLPAEPFRRRLAGLPSFVTVRGGEYFFMPGIAALGRLLAACRRG